MVLDLERLLNCRSGEEGSVISRGVLDMGSSWDNSPLNNLIMSFVSHSIDAADAFLISKDGRDAIEDVSAVLNDVCEFIDSVDVFCHSTSPTLELRRRALDTDSLARV